MPFKTAVEQRVEPARACATPVNGALSAATERVTLAEPLAVLPAMNDAVEGAARLAARATGSEETT